MPIELLILFTVICFLISTFSTFFVWDDDNNKTLIFIPIIFAIIFYGCIRTINGISNNTQYKTVFVTNPYIKDNVAYVQYLESKNTIKIVNLNKLFGRNFDHNEQIEVQQRIPFYYWGFYINNDDVRLQIYE